MRRLSVVALICVLALVAASAAAAAGHHGKGHAKGKAKFQAEALVVGVTAATDMTAATIDVTILSGSKAIKGKKGQTVTMTVDAKARLVGAEPLTLDAFVAGSKIHIGGQVTSAEPGFTATKLILQELPAAPETPEAVPAA